MGAADDEDELRRALAEAEAARARWQALVEAIPGYLMQVDRAGLVVFMNRPSDTIRIEDALGRPYLDLISEHDRPKVRAALDGVFAGTPAATVELTFAGRDGRMVHYQIRLGPVRRDGAVVGALVIGEDVTQRRETEAKLFLSDRMASVGTLAAGVAHEINNPLASVIANLDLVLRELAEQGGTGPIEELRDARIAADRVREIVRDLKLFSRAEEEGRGPVEVERVLESTLRMAGNEIRHRARLVRDYRPLPQVIANESRLGQVFLNLIINAVQALPEGAVQEHVIRVRTQADERGRAVVRIADTGPGIPADIRGRVFTPFFTTKPVGVGTGLGLSICHQIVTGLGGEISFESEVGRGTEFRVVLPPATSTLRAPTVPLPARVTAGRGRVLVVDDEPLITRVVGRILGAAHDVTGVNAAGDALVAIRDGARFDVILCDLMMPQMSGVDLHAAILEVDPDQARRMVFMTGGAFTPRATEFLAGITNTRVDKPFDAPALRELIDRMVASGPVS